MRDELKLLLEARGGGESVAEVGLIANDFTNDTNVGNSTRNSKSNAQ